MRAFVESALSAIAIFGLSLMSISSQAYADETWVKTIRTTSSWASYPCSDWLVTVACGSEKDFGDAGALPPVVSLGDTIEYSNKKGVRKTFRVEAISFFVFEKDVFDKQALVARRGETSCYLFDSTKAFRSQNQLSKIVVKGCLPKQ